MLKPTKATLHKIESIFQDLEYTIRYEKGNFNAGYCIVEDRKIVVINRFFDTEGRINCLLDILSSIKIVIDNLSEESLSHLKSIQKSDFMAEEKMSLTI
jgi:hypothetical protein